MESVQKNDSIDFEMNYKSSTFRQIQNNIVNTIIINYEVKKLINFMFEHLIVSIYLQYC